MKKVDFYDIIGITGNTLNYRDNNGEGCEIDLEACRQYQSGLIRDGNATDILGDADTENDRYNYVARCSVCADPPYYEFSDGTDEAVRFELYIRPTFLDYFRTRWRERFYEDFYDFGKKLRLSGFSIYEE